MNIFQLEYETRLRSWYELRNKITDLDTPHKCVETDAFWQKTPLVNHHLHLYDVQSWPDPWQLLVENTYCSVARALGMCYTLLLVGIDNVEIVEATNCTAEDVVLVLVDDAKYVLNYWPGTVLNNCSKDFTIRKKIDVSIIKQKLQGL
jgi:hypothetical protein